jgi:alkylation response protein AidB-like acyl-CoA dehydrogenase
LTVALSLPTPQSAEHEDALRDQVRRFLASQTFKPRCDAWMTGFDPSFSRRLGAAGLVGVTIPTAYAGRGLGALERYVISEELLAAGAPVAAHWVADRQSAALLLRFGTEQQRRDILPRIAAGDCYFAIGMSEPDAGSDLASIRTRAEPVDGGWLVNGRKIWTSHAHACHYMIALVRTGEPGARQAGLTQLIVDLTSPGLDLRPIDVLSGPRHFSEVLLEDVFVPDGMLIGAVGAGWSQVTAELAFERSGPERLLSTFPLLREFVREAGSVPSTASAVAIGRLVAETAALRRLTRSVATSLAAEGEPMVQAALVKDAGTRNEQAITEMVRLHVDAAPRIARGTVIEELLAQAVLAGPSMTLRGGTTEILRGIVARALGIR